MSDVWYSTDIVLGRPVAVKVVAPALLTEPGFAQRFRTEARTLAGLRHPGIVHVYDYGQAAVAEGEISYLVMELVHGQPLSERLAAAERLDADEVMSIVAQAADALRAAHVAGVVHRDVKPGNLLLRPDGSVVLVDFGVATTAATSGLTEPNQVLGTARYMAPEQVSQQGVSPASDIYSLGVVAYECLTGSPPFTGDSALTVAMRHVHDRPPPLPAEVPAATRAVVERAMAKDPADRYPTAAALAAAARAATAEPTQALVPSDADEPTAPVRPAGPQAAAAAPEPAHSTRRRNAILLSGVAASILAVVLLVASPLGDASPRHVGPTANSTSARAGTPGATQAGTPTTSATSPGRSSSSPDRTGAASPRPQQSAPPATGSPKKSSGVVPGITIPATTILPPLSSVSPPLATVP